MPQKLARQLLSGSAHLAPCHVSGMIAANIMQPTDPSEATLILQRMSDGDSSAAEDLMPIVYDELHRIAARLMQKQSADHTLQPTALINEAFMKIVGNVDADYAGRLHFMRVAASAMRSVLIDHARAENAKKRGGGQAAITLHEELMGSADAALQVMVVHEGIEELSKIDPQLGDIVELRFFGGFSHPEIAEALQISLRSVERAWKFARSWLKQFFGEAGEGES